LRGSFINQVFSSSIHGAEPVKHMTDQTTVLQCPSVSEFALQTHTPIMCVACREGGPVPAYPTDNVRPSLQAISGWPADEHSSLPGHSTPSPIWEEERQASVQSGCLGSMPDDEQLGMAGGW
jgi:hypothetical protein